MIKIEKSKGKEIQGSDLGGEEKTISIKLSSILDKRLQTNS